MPMRILTPDGTGTTGLPSGEFLAGLAERLSRPDNRDARSRAIRDTSDLADYAWDEATRDAETAHTLLITPTDTAITTTDLLERLDRLTADGVPPRTFTDPPVRRRQPTASEEKRGTGRAVIPAVA